MVSFLTTAKSFLGLRGRAHCASLENWRCVIPEAEIVLFGNCEGASPVCKTVKATRVEDIASSSTGVPRFDAIAEWALENARFDLQVYVNADILLPPDFGVFVARAPSGPFLMVGQRIDLREGAVFDAGDFYGQLKRAFDAGQAEVHRPAGMDFFVFRRGQWRGLDPLFVGRGMYDSALVAHCLRQHIPVIDVSFAFPAVHQWHDYAEAEGGKEWVHRGPEARLNRTTHRLRDFSPNCVDADLSMSRSGALVGNDRRSLLRRLEFELYYRRGWTWTPPLNQAWHLLTRGGRTIATPEWRNFCE